MSHRDAMVLVAVASLLTLTACIANAQVSNVFNMPKGEASLQFVTVGNPNNPPDTGGTVGDGAVDYAYQMGEYDVTVGQYCQFLNAVAATDTYGLYNSGMATDYSTVGIVQNGRPGSYTYSVSYNASAWNSYVAYNSSLYPSALAAANDAPIFAESWGDAARFCNWLQNDQPTGAEGDGTTETGAYTLGGAVTRSELMAINRNAGATYFIPSENEWYKAAFYKGGSLSAGYWAYETQSDTAPVNILSATGTNNANFYDQFGTGNGTYTDPTNYLTPVGAFAASPGSYGTFDMGGDVWQWTEANIGNLYRGMRGGAWDYPSYDLPSSYGPPDAPTNELYYIGFRVASVPVGWHDPGDANLDGTVDINDLTIVLTNFGQSTGMSWETGDFVGDGTVDINDLSIVLANFGMTYGASATGPAVVPEPSAILLVGVGGLVACTYRRRR